MNAVVKFSKTKTEAVSDQVQFVPLGELSLSKLNPRQDVDPDQIACLAESIVACGLIQNLAGLRTGQNTVEIVAGGRRYRALQAAVEQRPDLSMVPVKVTDDPETALRWASVENTAREPLHPVDEIIAYGTMAKSNSDTARIAKAFGVSEAHVRRRLALSDLPEAVHAALRAGEVTLSLAAAMTVSSDQEAILGVLKRCQDGWMNEYNVRQALKPDSETSKGRIGAFVGLEAYTGAGGVTTTDLFEDEILLDSPEILQNLFDQKLADAAQALNDTHGWAFVQTMNDASKWAHDGWFGKQGFIRVYPVEGELTDTQNERYEELADLQLEQDLDAQEQAEFEAFEAILEGEYTPEQKTIAGGVVFVNSSGDIEFEAGLIKAEDQQAAIEAGIIEASKHTDPSPVGQGGEKPAYSQKFLDDMKAIRLAALQTALLSKPDFVLDLAAFGFWQAERCYNATMAISFNNETTTPEYDHAFKLDTRIGGHKDDDTFEVEQALRDEINGHERGAFEGFRAKGKKFRNAILTEIFAQSLKTQRSSFMQQIEAEAGADIRSIWTPTAENCFARLKGPQLEALFATLLELKPDNAAVRAFAKGKKGEKVAILDGLFNSREAQAKYKVTPEQKAVIDAWVPDCIR